MMAKTAAIEKLQMGKTTAYCKSFGELDSVTAKSVAEAAKDGDETALKVYSLCGEMLGRGISIIVDILNPEMVVIGSIYQRSSELLRESVERVMLEECLESSRSCVKVVPALLGDNIGDIAALTLAMSCKED